MQVPSSQLIDPSREEANIRLWHDQLFAKPAKHGGVVAWYVIHSNIILCTYMQYYVVTCNIITNVYYVPYT